MCRQSIARAGHRNIFLWRCCTHASLLLPASPLLQASLLLPVLRIRIWIRIGSGFNQVLGSGTGFGIRIQGQESEEEKNVNIFKKSLKLKNTVPGTKIPPALHQESR